MILFVLFPGIPENLKISFFQGQWILLDNCSFFVFLDEVEGRIYTTYRSTQSKAFS